MSTEPEKRPEDIPAEAPQSQAQPEAMSEADAASEDAPVDLQAARIAQLEKELADLKDRAMRALADAENTRRRALKDRDDAAKYAVASFAKDLLDFSDNFHRALDAIPSEMNEDQRIASIVAGLQAMDSSLLKTFDKHGIKKIEPMDETFNPNFHEVMFEAAIPGKPAGLIIQVVEAGYTLNDRLLKAAKVGVSKGAPGTDHQVDKSA